MKMTILPNETYRFNVNKVSLVTQSYLNFATPWTTARQDSLSITNSQSLLKLMSIIGDVIQLSHPLSSSSPPTFNISQHQSLF